MIYNKLPPFLIAEAADGKTVVLVVVVPVHVRVVVVQVAVVGVVAVVLVLRGGPEIGVVARVVEPVVPVVASGNGPEARSLFISSRSNVAFASLADGSAF